RRLSTPTLTDFHQIRLGSRIHAADTPANPPRPASDSFRLLPPTEEKEEEQEQSSFAGRFL
ncbi:hypothetical protein, partial [Stenotrophomonas maltophilia]|uniref:hypothetical protein n=1 Tax=Stenotrophomonas maltophilia TaxID=40324 RepID=UPI0019554C6B